MLWLLIVHLKVEGGRRVFICATSCPRHPPLRGVSKWKWSNLWNLPSSVRYLLSFGSLSRFSSFAFFLILFFPTIRFSPVLFNAEYYEPSIYRSGCSASLYRHHFRQPQDTGSPGIASALSWPRGFSISGSYSRSETNRRWRCCIQAIRKFFVLLLPGYHVVKDLIIGQVLANGFVITSGVQPRNVGLTDYKSASSQLLPLQALLRLCIWLHLCFLFANSRFQQAAMAAV